jgi:hypothetical protein
MHASHSGASRSEEPGTHERIAVEIEVTSVHTHRADVVFMGSELRAAACPGLTTYP